MWFHVLSTPKVPLFRCTKTTVAKAGIGASVKAAPLRMIDQGDRPQSGATFVAGEIKGGAGLIQSRYESLRMCQWGVECFVENCKQAKERAHELNSRFAAFPAHGRRLVTTVRLHWQLYVFESAELALFMIAACFSTVLLYNPASPLLSFLPSADFRRLLMGAAMGVTAILIIHSPMGKRSGAHFNPAITLTYLRLGKIARLDALFYVLLQFIGGIVGVALSALVLGPLLASPSVVYAETVPGKYGTGAAFAAECFMAALLMGVVLWTSNRPSLAALTGYFVGILIALYVFLFAPISGFSINPARTTASAVFANVWTAIWLYFSAPLLGMFCSAEIYLHWQGPDRILCAKLHPDPAYECPFLCTYPGHRHHPIPAKNPIS
jgi:aquaporin Z